MSEECKYCKNPGLFTCVCSPMIRFCNSHLVDHVNDSSSRHEIIRTFEEVRPEQTEELLSSLKSLKYEIFRDKSRIINLGKHLFAEIQELLNDRLSKLSELLEKISQMEKSVKKSSIITKQSFESPLESWVLGRSSVKPYKMQLSSGVSIYDRISKCVQLTTIVPSSPEKVEKKKEPRMSVSSEEYPKAFAERINIYEGASIKTISSDGPKCRIGHPLKWNNLAVFAKHAKTNSIWIKCEKCNCNFSKSCWMCEACDYYLCDRCDRTTPPKLVCQSNHELEYFADAKHYYQKVYGKSSFKCKGCNKLIQTESSWHCRACEYDVCEDCAAGIGYKIPAVAPVDFSGKPLKLVNDPLLVALLLSTNPVCSVCKCSIQGEHYINQDGNFLCCASCVNLTPPYHPGIRCLNNHLLYWTSSSAFICDTCGKEKNEARFRCKPCDFDICSSCSNNFIRAVRNGLKHTCQHGHLLDWDPTNSYKHFGSPWTCNLGCNRAFQRSGAFRCNYCKYEVCIECIPKV